VSTPLLVLGTSDFAVEIADVASDCPELQLAGFVENLDRTRCDEPLEGLPVHWVDELGDLVRTHVAICGLGTTKRSRFTAQAEALGLRFATVVHPSARVSRTTSLGDGTIVSAGAVVGAHAQLGRHVIVSRGALVGHHTSIGAHSSVQAGANIAGSCRLGEAVFVGMGVRIVDHRSVGSHSVLGAGAVVTRDLPEHVLAVGIPARIRREGVEGL
jgi:sugar O-acyltransferase (sialic acid O-acetyltransferase NeuD family)